MLATTSSHHALVILFDAIVLVGVLLFACTLLPAIFSKGVQRSIGWYSLMTAWLVYSLSYGILVGWQEGPEPPFKLCLFQTLLIYATPPLVAVGTLCYYIEFFLIISGLKSGNPRQPSSTRAFWLVSTPWLVFFAIIVEVVTLIYAGGRLPLVSRAENNFYCHLGDTIPNQVTGSVIVCAMVILIPLEVWTGSLMYKNWDVFRRLSQIDRQIFLAVYLRLILCTLAAVIAFAFSTLAVVFPAPDATSLVYPALSIFVGFAFGTQKDLLRAWLFWRPLQPYGSIVFNNGTAIITSVYTSCGGADPPGGLTETELQQQCNKTITAESVGNKTSTSDTLLFVASTSSTTIKEPGSNSEASLHPVIPISRREQSAVGQTPEVKLGSPQQGDQRRSCSLELTSPLSNQASRLVTEEPSGWRDDNWKTPPV